LFRLQGNQNQLKKYFLKQVDRVDRRLGIKNEETKFADYIVEKNMRNNSQFYQDLFVSYTLKDKKNGFFVEFGACDGVHLSNTYFLEKQLNWIGILSEPAKIWHQSLSLNRNCTINKDCISPFSGYEVDFSETTRPELSTVDNYLKNDLHASRRIVNSNYKVNTLSLNDLLLENNAPKEIDFVSIDTEGSEIEIIQQFDFKKYHIKIVIIEHNYDRKRRIRLREIFDQNNFRPVFTKLSGPDFWFVNKNIS
jgi:FkbM family methyltransferase